MTNVGTWVDPFLKGLFQRQGVSGEAEGRSYLPPTDILEAEGSWVIVMDMPGVDEKSTDLQLEDGILTVTGRPSPELRAGTSPVLSERAGGPFRRRFTLAEKAVDTAQIRATVKNGVLRVTLPKLPAVRPQRIPVQGESRDAVGQE